MYILKGSRIAGLMMACLAILVFTSARAQTRVTLSQGETYSFSYCVNSNNGTIGVLTLRHISGGANFDLYLYSNSARTNRIGQGTLGGTNSELVVFAANSDRCVYGRVRNHSGRRSTYNLYGHQVSYIDNIAAALATAAIQCVFGSCGDQGSSSTENTLSVVMDTIIRCIGEPSRANTISCYNRETRNRLGRGFWSIFAIDLGSFVLGEIYRFY